MNRAKRIAVVALALVAGPLLAIGLTLASEGPRIDHIVVIFQENVSFDHYFATYPVAQNPDREPAFQAGASTPSVNGLTDGLLTSNPNSRNPFRLDRSQLITCDVNHDYTPEQRAYDGGLLDRFVEELSPTDPGCLPGLVMGHYDGNTVTALWNYAQHFAMSDNSFSSTFGPSTPGHLNLVAGQTHGASPTDVAGEVTQGTIIGDPRPLYDDCASGVKVSMTGTNVGDLLNAKGVTWGWFQGGFRPTGQTQDGKAICGSKHANVGGGVSFDYASHHEPFMYYLSTSNSHHLPPSSPDLIGQTDQANHQYDLQDFWTAIDSGRFPAVSFLKAARYQDGHAGYSDPLDEQAFIVSTINRLQRLPEWKSTLVIVAYDDSDGWYDHVMPPIVSPSSDPTYDVLLGAGRCGRAAEGAYQGRCGYGPRQPLLLISPWVKPNFVDHQVTDQSSILRFMEDNWSLGRIGDQSFDARAGSITNMLDFGNRRGPLFLDPTTGEPSEDSEGNL